MAERPMDALFVAMHDELRRLAEIQLRRLGPDLSLGASTLLHEAYLNLADRDQVAFPDQPHFLGYAARAMRSIVIDYARKGLAQKRGGGEFAITLSNSLDGSQGAGSADVSELERLSDALDSLAQFEPRLAQLVDLHFFCGYSFVEIAEMRETSERTVQRDWRKARIILQHALQDVAGE